VDSTLILLPIEIWEERMPRSRRWLATITVAATAAITILATLVAWPQAASAAATPFFTPAASSGSLPVKLHPTQGVPTGSPKLVTFGVPLPRGSITVAGLSTVRVMRGGTELPAYVEQLTPWRHATNPALDGTSVRVMRIQLNYTFAVSYPNSETVTVTWGGPNRSATIPTAPGTG
jgi:hypothetical protein